MTQQQEAEQIWDYLTTTPEQRYQRDLKKKVLDFISELRGDATTE